MKDSRPYLVATESTKHPPLLIIDKKGTMGLPLVQKLREQFLVVFVTGVEVPISRQVIHIPYRRKVPKVPDDVYSHMFVFYNGEEEILEMLPALMKKAHETNATLLFITSLLHTSPQLSRRLSNHTYQHMHVIVYGEVFAPNGRDHNITTMLLHQAKKFGRMELPNDGMGKLYPILLDDVFSAIIATAFATERRPHLLCVFPTHPVTELTVARMLQKQDPSLRLDFKKYKGSPPRYYIPQGGVYYYPEYPLEEKIKNIADSFVSENPVNERRMKKRYAFPKAPRKVSYRVFWFMLFLLLLFPILITAFVGVSGAAALQLSVREIEKGNLASAKQYAIVGHGSLATAETIGNSLFYLDLFVRPQKEEVLRQIRVAKRLAAAETEILEAVEILHTVSQGKSSQAKDDFQKSLATLKNALITVQKMRAEGELPRSISGKLTAMEPVLVPFANTIDAFPAIFGFEGERVYLVLFQNNMELRPGGGFIGSYGLLKLEQGRVKDFAVHDVYDADGRLTIHIEPPYGLRRYLGASHWFLRDSNFASDFPQNAKQAMTFLQLETGQDVQGVIGVDTTFIQNILAATGPVNVTDYKEVVTAENFYLRTQTHAEKDFFPGSTQKKDFLAALLTALEQKLAQQEGVNFQTLIEKVGKSIHEKHVLFAFADDATQQLFTVNNLSSSLWDGREREDDTYLDFFGVVDANVGINKVNYYLRRAIDQKVVWNADGSLRTTVTITYENTSKRDTPFGGDYKNYLRFLLPPGVQLRDVMIDGVRRSTVPAVTDPEVFTADDFEQPEELEIDRRLEQGKDTIGFLVTVPTGRSRRVSLVYEVPAVVRANDPVFTYDLRIFKQPGTGDDPYSFTFSYPSSYQVVQKDQSLSDVGGKLLYSDTLSNDKELRVEFSKK